MAFNRQFFLVAWESKEYLQHCSYAKMCLYFKKLKQIENMWR